MVGQVFGQYPAQVMLVDDQQPVEELAAQGACGGLGRIPMPSAVNMASKEATAHYVL